jgi:hypothetical protein
VIFGLQLDQLRDHHTVEVVISEHLGEYKGYVQPTAVSDRVELEVWQRTDLKA